MPKRTNQDQVVCQFFVWRCFVRGGIYYADGRHNQPNLGKHSLGTRNKEEALARLRQLDLVKAIAHKITDARPVQNSSDISIVGGWSAYLAYSGRSQVLGGVSPNSLKRYRAVRDKHVAFCSVKKIDSWIHFDRAALESYGNKLSLTLAARTVFLELTLVKSVVNWLVGNSHLPSNSELRYQLTKPNGSDTYCYRPIEVSAMVNHCQNHPGLAWLGEVILILAHTGLRIGELASLRWTDINFHQNTIRVADERASQKLRATGLGRTTKGRRSRMIPLHPVLREMLASLAHQPDGYVVHALRGGRLLPRNVLQAFIKEVIRPLSKQFPTPKGEIGFEHGRLHSFRHYFCSKALLCGASEGEVREWLGHADSKMVEHYRHLRADDAHRKMANIDFLGRPDERPNGP